ncbi:MAG: DUF4268 domain-containing protein [Chloroflexi bacterium]|nr:DUF4268 domain-containing protein [Chloroflexota bacterium]
MEPEEAPSIDEGTLHKIQRIDARRVWRHEALQFTPWLEENIEQLNEALGLEIALSGREERVGAFAVDLYGTDLQTSRPVVIENQLEDSDHSHLGQLLTYAAGLKAGVVMWVCPKFREEHRAALNWLNEISPETVGFYGVEVEILEIDGKRGANFKPLIMPAIVPGVTVVTRGGQSERAGVYQVYFARLLEELKERLPGATTASKTQATNWFSFSSGRGGVMFGWSFTAGSRFRTELYIDTGDSERNLAILEALLADQDAIEREVGVSLDGERLEHARAKRIAAYAPHSASILGSEDELSRLRDWAVNMMIQFVRVFRPRLQRLP